MDPRGESDGIPADDEIGEADEPAQDSVRQVFAATFGDAVRGSGLGQLTPGEIPRASSLLRVVGGVRGLVESILPGLGFLIVFTITRDVVLSVLAPVAVALVFVVIRMGARSSPTLAFAGLFGVGISAVLALMTGRAEDNFLPGLIINICSVIVLLVSIAVRWPLIGVIVGVLSNEMTRWRQDPAKRRVLTFATWLWVALFLARLLVQGPLYLASQTEWLAATKLIMGVPLYAAMVWLTWLLVRSVFPRPQSPSARDTL